MTRTIIFSLFYMMAGLCAETHAQVPFSCHVRLDSAYKGRVYLAIVRDRLTKLDSIDVDGREFSIQRTITEGDEYRILSRPYRFDISLLAEPGCSYEAEVVGHEATVVSADGKEQMLWNEVERLCRPLQDSSSAVGRAYMEAKEKGDTLTAEMLSRRNIAFFDSANAIKRAFIMAHPHSLAGMKAASEYLSMDYDDMRSLHDALSGSPYRHSSLYRSFDSRYRELAGKWMQGRRAPGFTTRDAAGREVSLSDFRGRYVLLDFWASWCVPCRAKMKELKRVYPQLKDKGIEVVSVSMDEKRGAWLQASRQDGVEWVNTCDVVPFADNKIGQAYKVSAVPALFVVSPQGRIIAQNPTIDFLLSLGSQ